MSDIVSYQLHGPIAVILVNNPPVNAISIDVRQGLVDSLNTAAMDDNAKAIVIACEGRTFLAGADIKEFGQPPQSPMLPDLLALMDSLEKPIITALHGTPLGGGLETALSAHFRIANVKTKVGLPEVKLGLLPGAGGTQRLPRLVGYEKAIDIITSGRNVAAAEAIELGLIDRISEGDLMTDALAYAEEIINTKTPLRRVSELPAPQVESQDFFDIQRKTLAKKYRHFDAPQMCVNAIEMVSGELPFLEAVSKERDMFIELMTGTQSLAQRHLFFAIRQASVISDIPKGTATREIKSVGIIGAGTMGTGIAMNFVNANIDTVLLEMNNEGLQRGLGLMDAYYDSRVAKGRMSNEQADKKRQLYKGTLSYNDLSQCDLIIEAVFENMDIKKEVFGTLDKICKPGAILASNTSTLDVDEIARATQRPQDVIGLHFFSPAQVMRLLEVVRGEKTADDVMATAMVLANTIKKVGAVSGVCDGFIGNRMLKGYGREAGMLLLEGASPSQIDKAMYQFGMAMGPLAMGDLAGLDVGYKVRQERRARGEDVPDGDGAVADRLVELGRKGQKTGAGYYRYEKGSRLPIADPEVDALIKAAADKVGVEQREFTDEEIVERLIYPLIHEAALILEEGIAQRPSDIDVVWTNGYGFPAHRGGPMFYADTVGIPTILARMEAFKARYGDVWEPAPLLIKLASEKKSFADL